MTDIGKILDKHIKSSDRFTSVPVVEHVKEEVVSTIDIIQRLTPRELQVFKLAVYGYITKEVAKELNCNEKTVEKHRQSIYDKLNIHSLAGLIWLYLTKKVPVEKTLLRGSVRIKSGCRANNNVERLYSEDNKQSI